MKKVKKIMVDTYCHTITGSENIIKGDTCLVKYSDNMNYRSFVFGVVEEAGYLDDDHLSPQVLFSKIHKSGIHAHFETKNDVLYLCYTIQESDEWFSLPLHTYEEDDSCRHFGKKRSVK